MHIEQTSNRLANILFEIGKIIGSEERLGPMLRPISEVVTKLCDAKACSILLLDQSRMLLLGKAAHGLARRDISSVSFRVGDGIAGWVANNKTPACIGDVTHDERYIALKDSDHVIRSLCCVPISHRGELIGVMTVTSPQKDKFKQDIVALLEFVAKTLAMDIQNIRLRRLSMTDTLTGVFNREYLGQVLPQAISDAKTRLEPLCVAMVDVDHFKRVNDQFGHAAGDDVLIETSERLRMSTRQADTLIRYGGEEFLLVLPNSDVALGRHIGERMRTHISQTPILFDGHALNMRVSVGVAEWTDDDNCRKLIQRADKALYQAKAAGRDRVEIAA